MKIRNRVAAFRGWAHSIEQPFKCGFCGPSRKMVGNETSVEGTLRRFTARQILARNHAGV